MADREPAPSDPGSPRTGPNSRPGRTEDRRGRTLGEGTGGTEAPRKGTSPSTSIEDPAAESAPPETPAALIGHPRYRVLRRLGSGGMGTVYLAEHRFMERQVALKVINRDLTEHASLRFEREVRAAARLQHPHIVTAFDADQVGSLHFLVMEYVEGVDLARLIKRRGPLPVAVACDIARQAALGLQHAHEHGMVHRDIKPQNLMRTRKGQVKILDFGLALFASEVDSDGFTGSGAVLGTADYIAPEQADDAHMADIRADIYSLGCTLYCLLAGHPPFPGGTLMQKLSSHARRTPRGVGEIRADLPRGLDRVIKKMMDKAPEYRYRTPAEVVDALAPFADLAASGEASGSSGTVAAWGRGASAYHTLPAPPIRFAPPRRRRTSILVASGLLLALGLSALAALAWANARRARQPGPIIAAVPTGVDAAERVAEARPAQAPTPVPTPPVPPPPPPPSAGATSPPVGKATGPASGPASPQPIATPPGLIVSIPKPSSSQYGPTPPAPSRPEPPGPSPDEVLQGKGLRRIGLVYRLEDEAQVDRKFQELQALQGELESGWTRLAWLEARINELERTRASINLVRKLPQPYPSNATLEERQRIDNDNTREEQRLASALQVADQIRSELGPLMSQQDILSVKVQVGYQDFVTRREILMRDRDALMRRYAELKRDPEVTAALAEMNRAARDKVVLGPVQDYAHYRKLVAGSARQTLLLKGVVQEKGWRYVLESERRARTQGNALRVARDKLARAEGSPRSSSTLVPELEEKRRKLEDELARASSPGYKAQLKASLDQTRKLLEHARNGPAASNTLVPALRADVLRAAVELRKTAGVVRSQREARLDEDPEVKAALADLSKEKSHAERARLAEVPEAEEALRLLDEVRAEIGLQEAPVRVEDGSNLVDGILDGVPTSGMVVDAEAAGLRLPAALAARAGVAPKPDAAPVPIGLADGRTVAAREASVRSLRIGTAELLDVPCLILPTEAGDVPPSLGTRALGASSAYLDPEGATLYLARFGPPSPGRP